MEHKFINRREELQWLSSLARKNQAHLVVIYGRRRAGKTALVRQFVKGKPSLYYLASKGSLKEQFALLSERCAHIFSDPYLKENPFQNWPAFFHYLRSRIGKKRFYLVLDEFPYLTKADPAVPSQFQKFWDESLKDTKIFLVLIGSSISMMYATTLAYTSPLYGRRTGQWKIKALDFWNFRKFFKGKQLDEIISFFAVTDGIPFYLLNLNLRKHIEKNIVEQVAHPGNILYEEGEILVKEELGDVPTYFSILEAIAYGKVTMGEISNFVGMPAHTLTGYLKKLLLTGLIIKEIPPTEKRRSKRGLYQLGDHFLHFWFRFIYPYKKDIESLDRNPFHEALRKNFNAYLGTVFESVGRAYIEALNRKGELPFALTRVGRWWHKDIEIDIVGLNEPERKILFGECKWKNRVHPQKILETLRKKAAHVPFNASHPPCFVIIAKSFQSRIKEPNVFLYDLSDIASLK